MIYTSLTNLRHALAAEIRSWRRIARLSLNGRDWPTVRDACDVAGLMGERYVAASNAMRALRHFATALSKPRVTR